MRQRVLPRGVLRAAAALVALAGPAAAQGEGPGLLRAGDGALREELRDEVPVSGAVVVGVMAVALPGGFRPSVYLPAASAGDPVCLSVTSRDGVYLAENTYRASADLAAPRVLATQYDSRYQPYLDRLGAGDVALRARKGACEGGDEGAYLISSSGVPDQPVDTLVVAVNSFGASRVGIQARVAGGTARGRCHPFDSGRSTSFDYRCEIDVSALPPGPFSVVVNRRKSGRVLPKVSFRIER